MKNMSHGRFIAIEVVLILIIVAMVATRSGAGESVQLVGTIKGAGCTHFRVECVKDDNHIALEDHFVSVMPNGEYYFMPNLYFSVKARHAFCALNFTYQYTMDGTTRLKKGKGED